MSKSVLELTPVEAVACCEPVTREPLSAEAAERITPLVKAIADPVRLRLLSLVASHVDGEAGKLVTLGGEIWSSMQKLKMDVKYDDIVDSSFLGVK